MTEVFVGVGSNVDREHSIRAGLAALRAAFGPLRASTVWDNPPVGFVGDPFLNLVVSFDTERPAAAVAAMLDRIEIRFGRTHAGDRKLLARALDLDLLLYGDAVIEADGVRVPRAEILEYAFVLAPLAELAPDRKHPVVGQTYQALWDAFAGDKSVLQSTSL